MAESFPPDDFVPVPSKIPGVVVFAPAPPGDDPLREVVDFKCPQCGGTTAYSIEDGGLLCTYCGHYEAPSTSVVGKCAQEFEFTVETVQRAALGWGESGTEIVCQNCGAHTLVPQAVLTVSCPFCGSRKAVQRRARQDVLRPRFLIPFQVTSAQCIQLARSGLVDSWMVPAALKRLKTFESFVGIYLPFWTFDSVTRADWQAEVGHVESQRHFSNGRWQTRTTTVWKWESGHVEKEIDDLLVVGTSYASRTLLERIKKYDMRQLTPYAPHYLAGFHAQAYDIPMETAWREAREWMRDKTRNECRVQASSSRIRNFSVTVDFDQESWRYILLPVYLANYTYRGKTYQVVINGQTGEVAGQRPTDWVKVLLAMAGIAAPGITLTFAGLVAATLDLPGAFLTLPGILLLVIGLVFDYYLLQEAMALDQP
jgi:DNA-directed RNA polymerase subunit RPC12/RpoP